jgi:hypothetical protein
VDDPCAIGRLGVDGPWVGFVRADGSYRLAVGGDAGAIHTVTADDGLLLALAIAYFEDDLDDPPPDMEATHADLSDLVRSVAARATEPDARRLLAEAVDAIDDGLAADEVIGRLVAAWRRTAKEQADPIDLLRERVAAAAGR